MQLKHVLLTALVSVVLGCSPDSTTDPVTGPKLRPTPPSNPVTVPNLLAGFFIAPDAGPSGDGTLDNPWTLSVALIQPGLVKPGDTLWLRGGTYTGEFTSELTGTPDSPVVLRQYPGEHAVIDGRLNIIGQHAYYWGFKVMSSDPHRVTAISGSDPIDLPRIRTAIFVGGPFNKLINMVVHDLSNGLFAGSPAQGVEIYGSIFYNNGWAGPDRGHGHNVYLQNQDATKKLIDNVIFGSFSSGLHIYGSSAAALQNFLIEGNTIFNSGDPVANQFGHTFNVEHWGGAAGTMANTIYKANSIYHRDGRSTAARFNAPGEVAGDNLQFSDNIVKGEMSFNEMKRYIVTGNKFTSGSQQLAGQSNLIGLRLPLGVSYSSHTWENNDYAVPPLGTQDPFHVNDGTVVGYYFPAWRAATGYDKASTFVDGAFSAPNIVVRPNRYEQGRAFITCWNWGAEASLNVDLSSVLKSGDRYEIRHVFDLSGAPLVSGVYNGSPVSIPQQTLSPPAPIGYTAPPPMPDNRFNVFVVQKV